MAFGKKKTLRVEFVDTKGERLIGFDELSLKEIPMDFSEETWVEIDGDRWKVSKVEPATAKKALRSGTLTVHVDLVEKRTPEAEAPAVEVKEVPVYSYPSRADQMPRMSGKRQDLRLLEMGTWEWRDSELTNASNRSVAKEVFGKIEELIQLNSTVRDGKTFFTRQYDRYDFFAPLRGSKVTLEMIVTDYFPSSVAVDGLTFMGADQVADSTFVFSVPSGVVFYGQEFDEVVRYLGVHRPSRMMATQLREDSIKLAEFMRKKGLILVDWPKRAIIEAEADALLDYFLEGFAADAIANARQTLANSPVEISASESPKVEVATPIMPVFQPEIKLEKHSEQEIAEPIIESVTHSEPVVSLPERKAEPESEPPVNQPEPEVNNKTHEEPIQVVQVEEADIPSDEPTVEPAIEASVNEQIAEKLPEFPQDATVKEVPPTLPSEPEAEATPETVLAETPPTILEFSSPAEELEVHEVSNLAEQDDSPEKEFKSDHTHGTIV
jgi:hypothetical protein